jgi:hypothetical protein
MSLNCMFINCMFINCMFINCMFINCMFINCMFINCMFIYQNFNKVNASAYLVKQIIRPLYLKRGMVTLHVVETVLLRTCRP